MKLGSKRKQASVKARGGVEGQMWQPDNQMFLALMEPLLLIMGSELNF